MLKAILKKIASRYGYAIVPKGLGYLDAVQTINAARQSNLSLAEYLETNDIGGVGVRRDCIIDTLTRHISQPLEKIVEIGTGTGIYMEKIHAFYHPGHYEIYETNQGWVDYLAELYKNTSGVKIRTADGETLQHTANGCIDAVYAHGVFVYIPLLSTVKYLQESIRVVKDQGYIIFDCFLDTYFTYQTAKTWQQNTYGYTFPVIIARRLLDDLFLSHNLELVAEFNTPYHASESTYFILRKK